MAKQYHDAVALRLRDMGVDERAARSFVAQAQVTDYAPRHTLLRTGMRSNLVGYLLDGHVRFHATDENGDEWVRFFARPGSFIGSIRTLLYDVPAEQGADCITKCKMLVVPAERFGQIYADLHVRTQLQDLIIQQLLLISQERADLLPMAARERYLYFREHYADVEQLVLKSDIASFLGIRQQSLSRILREFK